MAELFTDPQWLAVLLAVLTLLLAPATLLWKRWNREKREDKARATRIKRTISVFLESLHQRRIWREVESYEDKASPEKMRESVEAIRGITTDAINSLRSENYEERKLKWLIDVQEACLALLDDMERQLRRLKEEEPTFGDAEFFLAVYNSQLSTFQNVVVESCQHLCEDQNLCGESPCRKIC